MTVQLGVPHARGVRERQAGRWLDRFFDRRETGQSGGRVEKLTWEGYARQGKELLQHLGFSRAHVIGACMGACAAAALAAASPQSIDRLVLYWPVGGAKYRIQGRARFNEHAAYVQHT